MQNVINRNSTTRMQGDPFILTNKSVNFVKPEFDLYAKSLIRIWPSLDRTMSPHSESNQDLVIRSHIDPKHVIQKKHPVDLDEPPPIASTFGESDGEFFERAFF